MKAILALLLTLVAIGIMTFAPASAAQPGSCQAVPNAWVIAVEQTHRVSAMSMLQGDTGTRLTEAQLATLVQVRKKHGETFAEAFLQDAIRQLEQSRDDELQRRNGSWSRWDQAQLDDLVRLRSERAWSNRDPYLVMAVAGFEGTGIFTAQQCGDDLDVSHASLGRQSPPPLNVPVIVFLDRKPGHIHTGMSVAE